MKQTEHSALNQWELSDRIRMDDFNADNAKIEAAPLGRVPMTVLHDETSAESQTDLGFDVIGEGWLAHSIIQLTLEPVEGTPGAALEFYSSATDSYRDFGTSSPT